MYRSRTKTHKFTMDWYPKTNLPEVIQVDRGLHPLAISQINIGGTTLIPTQKSATASETTNALVLVRSCRFLQTRKTINPFPVIVRMESSQPRIQNQVSILHWLRFLLVRHPGTFKNWYHRISLFIKYSKQYIHSHWSIGVFKWEYANTVVTSRFLCFSGTIWIHFRTLKYKY